MNPEKAFITARQIQLVVASHFNVTIAALLGNQRSRAIVIPRSIAMLLCRDLLPSRSYPELGKAFNRDHTSVMAGCIRAQERILGDSTLRVAVSRIRKELAHSHDVSDISSTAYLYAEAIVDAFRRSVMILAAADAAGFIRRAAIIISEPGAQQ
jgi:Bacterial dnaA protein helix-turn-helix